MHVLHGPYMAVCVFTEKQNVSDCGALSVRGVALMRTTSI